MLDLDTLRAVCMEKGEVVKFKRGECFAHAGEILARFGIVNRGLFGHMTYSCDGIAHITGFSFEGTVVSNWSSAIYNHKTTGILSTSDTNLSQQNTQGDPKSITYFKYVNAYSSPPLIAFASGADIGNGMISFCTVGDAKLQPAICHLMAERGQWVIFLKKKRLFGT